MKFSARPQPMQFGSLGAGAQDQSASGVLADSLGFRPLEAADVEHPVTLRGRTTTAPTPYEHDAESSILNLEDGPPSAWPIWLTAVAVSVLWAIAPIAFAVGYRNDVAPLQNDAFALAVFALLAIGPAAFVLGAAYMIRQGQKLAFEARRSKAMAEDMLVPALIAAARAGDVAQAIRDEIARAGAAADDARSGLVAMRDALAFETDKLTGATAQSVRTARELAETLGRERSEMTGLAQILDTQATRVTDAVAQQARMVTEAAGVAETQIREAETTLSARAADLAAAAGVTSDAARVAGEDLTRHIARLESAGVGVADQISAVETGLAEQRTALVALSQVLKSDQVAFAADAEIHAAQLDAFIGEARRSVAEMSEQAGLGGEALRGLLADAALQFRDLAETALAEREEFGQATLQSLDAVSSIANAQRTELEAQTRAAIDTLSVAAEAARIAAADHAARAREQVDQLAEAAFTAGQKANQVFQDRLEEARALVEQSSRLVDEAGAANARALEGGAVAARATLDELSALLADVEDSALRLPEAARSQAEQVRLTVAQGMDDLMTQARKTVEEAQAIDLAFQARVDANARMLSEAVRRMDLAPASALATEAAAEPGLNTAETSGSANEIMLQSDALATPALEPVGAILADRIGLRNRIRLTPTATDREFSAIFEAAGGPPASAANAEDAAAPADGWTWRDLLASLDGVDGDGERLSETLGAELSRMGVDSERLLPHARVDEIAAAMQTGDFEGGREVVRKLAPAATRRIARRLFTDDEVRRKTETYVQRYKSLINDAAARDPEGMAMAGLLNAPDGRIFLLLDAAAGDMI